MCSPTCAYEILHTWETEYVACHGTDHLPPVIIRILSGCMPPGTALFGVPLLAPGGPAGGGPPPGGGGPKLPPGGNGGTLPPGGPLGGNGGGTPGWQSEK